MSGPAERLLVTFPNVRVEGAPRAALVDPSTGAVELPRLPAELAASEGCTGAAVFGDRLLVVQPNSSTLFVLGPELEIEQRWELTGGAAAHSILVEDDRAWLVATDADAVVPLVLSDRRIAAQEEPLRLVYGEAPDQLHLNGICRHGGRLLVTGIGRRHSPDAPWSSAVDGILLDVESGETLESDLLHPHSPTADGDGLLVCESRASVVRALDWSRATKLEGYVRGLALVGDDVYAGVSRGRVRSESSGAVENPADPGGPSGACGVHRLDRRTLAPKQVLDLAAFAREIYEIVPVPDASRWPLLDPAEVQARLIPTLWDALERAGL